MEEAVIHQPLLVLKTRKIASKYGMKISAPAFYFVTETRVTDGWIDGKYDSLYLASMRFMRRAVKHYFKWDVPVLFGAGF